MQDFRASKGFRILPAMIFSIGLLGVVGHLCGIDDFSTDVVLSVAIVFSLGTACLASRSATQTKGSPPATPAEQCGAGTYDQLPLEHTTTRPDPVTQHRSAIVQQKRISLWHRTVRASRFDGSEGVIVDGADGAFDLPPFDSLLTEPVKDVALRRVPGFSEAVS